MMHTVLVAVHRNMCMMQYEASDYGDLGYLLQPRYDAFVRDALNASQVWDWKGQRVSTAPGGVSLLLPYLGETYSRLARQLRTWPFPRGHYRHALYLRTRGTLVWLADQRFCLLLPEALRVRANPGLRPVVAKQSQDCNDACRLEVMENGCMGVVSVLVT